MKDEPKAHTTTTTKQQSTPDEFLKHIKDESHGLIRGPLQH